MRELTRILLAIALVLGIGPQARAAFSIDQAPTEIPMFPAGPGDPGDIVMPGLAPVVDDGDGLPGAPLTLMVPGLPGLPYDTDGISFAVPNDPFAPMAGAPSGVLVSIDDGDIGPGLGPPDNAVELYFAPLPPVGASTSTKATEAFLGLLGDPPPVGLDDDVDAYEDRIIPGPPGAYFSPDWDAPAGLDPGDIFFSPLVGGPPVLVCDDFTQMGITTGDPAPAVDVDAVHLVPNTVCGMFPPLGSGPLCFLFSLDNVPAPPMPFPLNDPGDIYITDCMNGSVLFLDDVTQMGLWPAPDEFAIFDIDAISVPDAAPGVCEFDGDGFFDIACGGTDCDDTDPNTYPGAPELCDGKDNDCDLVIPGNETDDDVPAGDGYVECKPWVGPPGFLGGDCDDTDPNINPGVVEDTASGNCADLVDNDCDTLTDGADPGCSGGSCVGSAAASVQPTPDVPEGNILNLLAFLLITVAVAFGIVVVRRRR